MEPLSVRRVKEVRELAEIPTRRGEMQLGSAVRTDERLLVQASRVESPIVDGHKVQGGHVLHEAQQPPHIAVANRRVGEIM